MSSTPDSKTRRAAVVPISSAPSFAGVVHEADWRTFSVVCTSVLRASLLTEHLRQARLQVEKSGTTVRVRYDYAQRGQRSTPVEVALAASTMGYADADLAAAALTAHVGETA